MPFPTPNEIKDFFNEFEFEIQEYRPLLVELCCPSGDNYLKVRISQTKWGRIRATSKIVETPRSRRALQKRVSWGMDSSGGNKKPLRVAKEAMSKLKGVQT